MNVTCHEDFSAVTLGTLPPRSYYVPFPGPVDSAAPRESSAQFLPLAGEWDFRYYRAFDDFVEDMSRQSVDGMLFNDRIAVPSNWQIEKLSDASVDNPQYVNAAYPFPFDPPYVPTDNPTGVYHRRFMVNKAEERRQYLVFEGVDAGFYVWINGLFAGYGEVPHATMEFDVTDKAVDGQNTIVVAVLKWCKGSYLNDQDKIRLSGIFRDVYLLDRPGDHLVDYTVTTRLSANGGALVSLRLEQAPAGTSATGLFGWRRRLSSARAPFSCRASVSGWYWTADTTVWSIMDTVRMKAMRTPITPPVSAVSGNR